VNQPEAGQAAAEPAFNLLDAPWLPVRWASGRTSDVGLLQLFAHSSQIAGLAEPSPPAFIALHRLLLAITHRALTLHQGRWTDGDRARWYRDGLPPQAFERYLDKWRERFWLFHPTQPFMQVAALATAEATFDRLKPWMVISLASSKGDTPVLFDHCVESRAQPITASEAARHLLGYLQFAPPGLIQAIRVSDKAGPLANTLAVAPIGETIGQSLSLGLHRFDPDGLDLPSWESAPVELLTIEAKPTRPTGPNDRYTRQTRAALLQPMSDFAGPMVTSLRFAAGVALDESPLDLDPMVPHVTSEGKVGAVRFKEGRAFWRDMPAILPKSSARTVIAPAIMSRATLIKPSLRDIQ
jgi:CRISPR system Cascade subunit CasA